MTPAGEGFPSARASAFAAQFAGVYLSFDAANAQNRAAKLAPYLPEDADDQFGWDGYGTMGAAAIVPYDIEIVDQQNAVVTVAFQSSGRRLLLSVPVYTKDGKFVVSGRPALLPAPAPADAPQVVAPETDDAVAAELRTQLEGFLKAYGEGDTNALRLYVADGKSVPGFGGAFSFVELKKLVVPVGGSTREIQAVVVWGVPSGAVPSAQPTGADAKAVDGRLEQAYRITVEKQGARWFVVDIRGAGRAVG
ncbi:conjugal transfer protein [Nonomuraea sp. NPDC050556]|uniref:conjugal transfer protein n=1 Tax=Nonomuraea sp. NPDC050556 TaxID=3364369 RepID=UPI0037BD3480